MPNEDEIAKKVEAAVRKVFREYGFHEDDRTETTLDMVHLRQSRKGTEQLKATVKNSAILTATSAITYALWLGFKALVGK